MEKKTIGTFIAALRKANGLTQRELAEQLNVSDKSVSRWERDDGAPDLSLIPVIAELFGVTCDELLRGERKSPESRAEATIPDGAASPKAEKAIRHMMQTSQQRFRTQSLITAGIAFAGVVVALIANICFLRGYVGFFLGLLFYAASAICQWIFTDRAWHGVTEDAVGENDLASYRWRVFHTAAGSVGVAFTVFCSLLPLLLSGGAYYGLLVTTWLGLGLLCCLAAAGLWYVIMCLVRGAMLRQGLLVLSDTEAKCLVHNLRLQRRVVLITAGILAATLFCHVCIAEIWDVWTVANGQKFEDYESFVAYMEQPQSGPGFSAASIPTASYAIEDDSIVKTLTLSDGTVVCEYQRRNENVTRINYQEKDGTLLPLEVITYADVQIAENWLWMRDIAFCVLYAAEVILAVRIYLRKRCK